MGIKFGEIDAAQIVDNEYRTKTVVELISFLIEKNKLKTPTESEMEKIKDGVIADLKEKYPKSGVRKVE